MGGAAVGSVIVSIVCVCITDLTDVTRSPPDPPFPSFGVIIGPNERCGRLPGLTAGTFGPVCNPIVSPGGPLLACDGLTTGRSTGIVPMGDTTGTVTLAELMTLTGANDAGSNTPPPSDEGP